ncbi:ABC transporter substrate-binding protein [Xanthobacter dioxanivorans]|uniref:ABC transporter substrate-binding protein n=1 Tax=Xanthobacter dioxanivorans TaxID=2528964 RepID=A0A974SLW9_9HYPH|nr:ABC transporter substrate-binding protein [Xanthobacter dioxanivorans]QRG08993.1 ABC transporter substrate-binding protein [Xanthobacter dioxanivorans]
MIRHLVAAAMLSLATTAAHAEFSNNAVKIVVLTDLSSNYSDTAGKGSVVAAELAIEDFGAGIEGVPIKLISADHQNKADLGALKARELIDTEGADVFVDLSNSAVSLAVQEIGRANDKAVLHVGSATAALYGETCSPTGALWLYDTYALAQGLGKAVLAEGGDSWYFITADYAFGKAMEDSLANVVKGAGGSVKGSVRHPVNNPDFSSFLLQAQKSGAKVIGLANASGDTVNAIKQAKEFGVVEMGQKLAAPIFYIQSAKAVGPELAQGLQFMTGYYWDRDDASRAFAKRFAQKMNGGMPSQAHAGVYSATLHYLRAAAAAKSDSGKVVLAKMKEMPVDDFFAEGAILREDGRLMKDMFLVEVKKPSEVTQPWDLLKVLRRMSAAEIIRPLDKGNCPFVKG